MKTSCFFKEELRQFWKQPSKNAAEAFLEAWCRRAQATSVRQLQTMAKTLQAHRNGLLNGYDEPIRVPASGRGPLEGINNKIEALQRRAYQPVENRSTDILSVSFPIGITDWKSVVRAFSTGC